jgi:putative salt-induced outer membrane protein YdiY
MENKKLIFKSQIAGEVSVDFSKVKEIYSEKLLEILLDDGKILKGKIVKSKADSFTVAEEKVKQEKAFEKSNLSSIYPLPKPKIKWSANITVGFTSSRGSSYSEDLSVDGSFRLRTEKHRFRLSSRFILDRSEDSDGHKITTEENFTVQGIYDYFFTEKIYGYWSERFKKDHIDDLDYRVTSALGAGYQWSETDVLDTSTFAGIGFIEEKYTSRVPDPTGEKTWAKDVSRRDDVILQLGYYFAWKPHQKVHLISNFAYNPDIYSFSEYTITHDSEVRAFITSSLYTSFKFILDYDSHPGEDSASTDTDYILGLGWEF